MAKLGYHDQHFFETWNQYATVLVKTFNHIELEMSLYALGKFGTDPSVISSDFKQACHTLLPLTEQEQNVTNAFREYLSRNRKLRHVIKVEEIMGDFLAQWDNDYTLERESSTALVTRKV